MDIDRFFALGQRAAFQANDIFVDRESYIELYAGRVRQHCAESWSSPALLDFNRPARNIMPFIGDGGIGKSTLGRHLVRMSLAGDIEGLPKKKAAAIIDFADTSSRSFETVLLRVRAALGGLHHSWPAFDVALSLYWERKYPGESLKDHLQRLSTGGAAGSRVAEQITGTVDQLLGGFGVTTALYQLANLAGKAAAKNLTLRRIQREQPAFEMLIGEKDPDRMLGYLPILLAGDLAHSREREQSFSLCVLDTFETVQALSPETRGLEDLVCRLVYLMPNVFFIASSRRPLLWHDSIRSVGLTYGGELRWPSLKRHRDAQDEMFVAGFDDESAESYLKQRLTRDGQPAIPGDIRRRIVAGSAGSPLYLELSTNLFEQVVARGETPASDMFGSHFPELVLRVMRDLSDVDRDLLRAAALLQAFDAEILRTVLPQVRRRQIEAFLERSFIARHDGVWPAYRIHENLRHAVLTCDRYTDDGWTRSELIENLMRAVALLEHFTVGIWDESGSSSLSAIERGRRAVAAFLLTFNAAVDHDVLPPQLDVAAYTLRELGHMRVLASLPIDQTNRHPDLIRLAAVARLAARSDLDAGPRYEEMKVAAGDLSQGRYSGFIHLELGHLALLAGQLNEADRHFGAVVDHSSVLALGAFFAVGGNALRRSQFTEMTRYTGELPVAQLDLVRYFDMIGHMRMHNGLFADAADSFATTLDHARQINAPLWTSRAIRHIALATMWFDPDRTLTVLPEARELNQALGDAIGVAQCDMAGALAHAFQADWDEAEQFLSQARDRLRAAGAAFELLPVQPVEVLVNLGLGRIEHAQTMAADLASAERAGHPAGPPVWTAVTALWVGRPDWREFDSIDWISPDGARQRWTAPLLRLREVGSR